MRVDQEMTLEVDEAGSWVMSVNDSELLAGTSHTDIRVEPVFRWRHLLAEPTPAIATATGLRESPNRAYNDVAEFFGTQVLLRNH